ncbi:MAG: ABC transporter ATP-binding protein [Pseudorhodoplanes sp.]|nr:ABC transporter ATP-binding protein [Pseudorhodoplanes sp.]
MGVECNRAAPPQAGRVLLGIENVTKRFGGLTAVDGVSLDIMQGEFLALLGPSGCGKTTLLRMLAGFEKPDEGRLLLEGRDITAGPPYRRPVNMMFQSYALFPHLTVAGNVAFGLRQEELSRRDIDARVTDILKVVRLEGLGHRRPNQLSGGQRQRVALARALVKRPKLFLLDEPLAALDKKLREETQSELRELQRRLGVTFVIVTHDQEEAMAMASRIAVMNEGRIVQVAPPAEIYEQPNSRWIAQFIGDVNLFEARVIGDASPYLVAESAVAGPLHALRPGGVSPGTDIAIAVRPEKIHISRATGKLPANAISGVVADVGYLGDFSLYKVRLDNGATVKAAVANVSRRAEPPPALGERVTLDWPAESAIVLTR